MIDGLLTAKRKVRLSSENNDDNLFYKNKNNFKLRIGWDKKKIDRN